MAQPGRALDHEGPRDGNHLECLGREVSLPSVVLTPFTGAYDLLGVGYCSGPIEALSECVPIQGSRHDVVTADPSVDIAQQKLPLFDGDTELQDPGVAPFIEFTLYKNEGLGTMCEPSSFCLVHRQRVMKEVVEGECSPVIQRDRLYRWILFKLHDLEAGQSRRLVSPQGWIRLAIIGLL